VIKSGLLIPKSEPLTVGPQDSEVCDVVGIGQEPSGAGFFESSLQNVPMTRLDHA
jgi:hypothetical protein